MKIKTLEGKLIKAKFRKAKAEAKKNIQKEDIKNFLVERQSLFDLMNQFNDLYNQFGMWKPFDLYSYTPVDVKKYTDLSACIKVLKKDITTLETIIKDHSKDIDKFSTFEI